MLPTAVIAKDVPKAEKWFPGSVAVGSEGWGGRTEGMRTVEEFLVPTLEDLLVIRASFVRDATCFALGC